MMKAVIFDIDGVLLDSFDANLKFFQVLMAKFGFKSPSRKDYGRLFHLPMYEIIKTLTNSASENKVKEIWEAGLKRDDATNEVRYPIELLKIPEGAHEVIEALNKHYLLAIVTSRTKEGIYSIPSLAKMAKHIQTTISYQDTKNHKPHPEPLLLAAEKLNIRPEEAVYIGDAATDMMAAKAAMMKFITYARKPLPGSDAYTFSFPKLPDLISTL